MLITGPSMPRSANADTKFLYVLRLHGCNLRHHSLVCLAVVVAAAVVLQLLLPWVLVCFGWCSWLYGLRFELYRFQFVNRGHRRGIRPIQGEANPEREL